MKRWNNARSEPVDRTLVMDLLDDEYDLKRPEYRCAVCYAEGELSLHRYLDECEFFEEKSKEDEA